jgi:cytidyltransferase-like protein
MAALSATMRCATWAALRTSRSPAHWQQVARVREFSAVATVRVGLYAGTFDPPSCGHLDIIERATRLCDTLVVAVARNPSKTPIFNMMERQTLLRVMVDDALGQRAADIRIEAFDGLIVEFARQQRGTHAVGLGQCDR